MVGKEEWICLVIRPTSIYIYLHVRRTGPVVTAYGIPDDIKASAAVVVTLLIFAYYYY
jgi:hypothetical protein